MSGETPIRQIRRFGIFEVDLRRRELLRNGLQIKLRDQSFLLLAALLEQPGELVTREELRSKLWPDGTFVDFDHSLNAAIKRLRDAIGDDPETPRFIETVPKRGYRFLAPVDDSSMRLVKTSGRRSMIGTAASLFRFRVLAGVVFVLVVVTLGAIRYGSRSRTPLARLPLKIVPLTTYPGAEAGSAFSGDGEQVAFVWDGNTLDTTNIYVKRIGIDPPLKLTRSDGLVCCAAWTSDSRYVGFERCSGENQGIYLVPSLGGPEAKITNTVGCNGISWSPREQLLAFSSKKSPDSPWALFLMPLDDRQPHQLTFPSADLIGDQDPVFSPDGKFIAFIRVVGEGTPDIYTAPVSGGPVRRLTYDKAALGGITWTSDGQKLVFSSHREGSKCLWVVPSSGGQPKRLPFGGIASDPSISRQGNRLSYTQGDIHPNLWVIQISGGAAMRNREAKPFFSSATYNNAARFSPDGKKIAFASLRSGDMEIWTCDAADCSEPLQLTFLKSLSGTPRWSPDSKRISFESRPHGHSQIFVISAEGGKPIPITDGTAEDKVTSWSPDGIFIYFASNRSGVSQIWKISTSGGQLSQVTRKGGFASSASSDGKFLYYVKDAENGIWRMPTTGGDEIAVLPQFPAEHWGDWALVDKGIYYVDEVGHPTIKFLNFVNHKVTKIVEVESLPPPGDPGFTVSPDEKQIVFSQIDRSAVDLMLVENFNVEP
jgi:Tol biopolymer transport system component/DNA-binding winged helix-turn-helix (wHTH) protein